MDVRAYEEKLNGSSLYPFAKSAYLAYRSVARSVRSVTLSGSLVDQSGFYRVNPTDPRIEPYYVWLPTARGAYHQRCIAGEYERPVMSTIADLVDEDTVFWNVGAGHGYHSFAVANRAETVVNFEARDSMVESLDRGIARNRFENCDLVQGYVGEDVHLDSYDPPDLVLIDTEGWEYRILDSAPETLQARPTWIVEMHPTPEATDANVPLPPEVDPDGVIELFEEHGYSVDSLQEHRKRSHVVATPDE